MDVHKPNFTVRYFCFNSDLGILAAVDVHGIDPNAVIVRIWRDGQVVVTERVAERSGLFPADYDERVGNQNHVVWLAE